METKQVIVIRREYPDGKEGVRKLRTGKMIAQACHASMAFLTRRMQRVGITLPMLDFNGNPVLISEERAKSATILFTEEEIAWLDDSFAKVCLYVNSEEELLDIYNKAKDAGLEVHLVTDSGRTEFNGVPTNTCLAIGPHECSKIDAVTGHLPLL